MKTKLAQFITVAMVLSIASIATAKSEKKNMPKPQEVEKQLKELGAEHYVEKMKIYKVGSLEFGDTYLHAFRGSLKEGGYRVIFTDNTGRYLGFYASEFEPSDYEEGAILLDSGDSDEDGNTNYFTLPLTSKGLADRVTIDGTPTVLVKAPAKEGEGGAPAPVATKAKSKTGEEVDLDYREWTISMRGKEVKFTAIYIKTVGSKVYLKEQKRGITKDFQINTLSNEDQEYLKQF